MLLVKKETRLNLRITPGFRAEIEQLAEYHGLTLSSYAHSVLVKAIRRERQELAGDLPNVNQSERRVHDKQRAPVVARIERGEMSKQDVQRMVESTKTIKVPVRKKVS